MCSLEQTETGSSGSMWGQLAASGWWLAAGGVRNTKDRDGLALVVRAGMLGMGTYPGTLLG